ncbi:YlbF family regulator [Romboutsia sp.]|uniref:YlbF family regulator n=1 Tax=Romboutsia sp. TaxID=1965302 RepID=UPI003F36CD83
MDINQRAKEFSYYVKNTPEFKALNKSKTDLEKNKSIKKQFDVYITKKNSIYSNYTIEDAARKMNLLNKDYEDFFNLPLVSNYVKTTKQFNIMMENLYNIIERELIK